MSAVFKVFIWFVFTDESIPWTDLLDSAASKIKCISAGGAGVWAVKQDYTVG